MGKERQKTLTCPPFPPLIWDDYWWKTEIILPSWKDYQTWRWRTVHPYPDIGGGRSPLKISVPNGDDPPAPGPAQVTAYKTLLKHESALHKSVLKAIFKSLSSVDAETPELDTPEQLRDHLCLTSVGIMETALDDSAYLRFGFECEWDPEHGLGVLTHKKRIVGVGEEVVYEWEAERDAQARGTA